VKNLDEVFWKLDAVGNLCEPTGDGKFGVGTCGKDCRVMSVGARVLEAALWSLYVVHAATTQATMGPGQVASMSPDI
jgi:hypothetical protein